jgi:DNA-directed RNA polymerase subunit H (RpoH/RPB5)
MREQYIKMQAAWVEEVNLKPGDKVKVLRKPESFEFGWPTGWTRSQDGIIGTIQEVLTIDKDDIELGPCYVPFFILEKVEEPPAPKKHDIRQAYIDLQAAWVKEVGLKEGDKVEILRVAKSYEMGWGAVWNPKMDDLVGQVATVGVVSASIGIQIDMWSLPFFILRKVEEPNEESIELTGTNYHALVTKEYIQAGCKVITHSHLDKIVEKMDEPGKRVVTLIRKEGITVSETSLESVQNKINDGRELNKFGFSISTLFNWGRQPEGGTFWDMASELFTVKMEEKYNEYDIGPLALSSKEKDEIVFIGGYKVLKSDILKVHEASKRLR